MKKIIVALLLILTIATGIFFGLSAGQQEHYLRIHIRANSNSTADQTVKYAIKDEVVAFLTPRLVECENFEQVKTTLQNALSEIEQMANEVLASNGFSYTAHATLNNEYFPSRYYDDFLLPADYYDALIVELGSAQGDNWWCVVYPPLCFVGEAGTGNVVYKSILLEMIEKFFASGG